jgi:tRNA U34 5-carboxymethylaminomethyl modifying GTPase MnmE/TrmE
MLSQADLVLLVLDNSGTNAQLTECLVEKMPARKILAVLNKSDLPAKFRPERLPKSLGSPALISAKSGDGIDALCDKICSALSVHHIEPDRPVCFTARQAMLVEQIAAASSPGSVSRLASELLNGRIVV